MSEGGLLGASGIKNSFSTNEKNIQVDGLAYMLEQENQSLFITDPNDSRRQLLNPQISVSAGLFERISDSLLDALEVETLRTFRDKTNKQRLKARQEMNSKIRSENII